MSLYSKVDFSNPYESDLWVEQIREILTIPNWHNVGGTDDTGVATEPAFENSWINFGTSDEVAAFCKDGFDRVWIKGKVKTGTPSSTVFTLPENYRPSVKQSLASVANGVVVAQIDIDTDGTVDVISGSSTWTSLHVNFRV